MSFYYQAKPKGASFSTRSSKSLAPRLLDWTALDLNPMSDNNNNQTPDTRLSFTNQPPSIIPAVVHSEILPGLWQGGTDEQDVFLQFDKPLITKDDFDSVYTLYAWANPVDWGVKETRLGFLDTNNLSVAAYELYALAKQAHYDWKLGKRVLIRCQAGLNRSGLIAALVLIKDGYQPSEAIALLRKSRSRNVLFNPYFEDWLIQTDHSSEL